MREREEEREEYERRVRSRRLDRTGVEKECRVCLGRLILKGVVVRL